MKKRRIIFFPVEMGLAHLTRSRAIAEELHRRGHEILFVGPSSKAHLFTNSPISFFPLQNTIKDEENIHKLKDLSFLVRAMKEEIEIIRNYKPDIAIIDLRISALVSCQKFGIPIVAISNSDGLPYSTYIPNIGLPQFVYYIVSSLLPFLIDRFKTSFINALSEAGSRLDISFTKKDLENITYIVPEYSDYLPLKQTKSNVHYCGPIFWNGFEKTIPSWLNKINPDGKTVYITFGGTGYDREKLISLSVRLAQKGYKVIVSSSIIAPLNAFPKLPNLYVEKYLPGWEICKRVDIVICHGGIGTTMQSIISGKPVLAIPFNVDQYTHSLRLEELGLARCITNVSLSEVLKLDWYSFQKGGRNLTVEKISTVLDDMIAKKDWYTVKIKEYNKKYTTKDGVQKAADIIERIKHEKRSDAFY